jgi:16S rRNA (uracil1498-N3)-methyltransferase
LSRHGHRFYVQEPLEADRSLSLPESVARQITSVLRLIRGDEIRLFNGDGREFAADITDTGHGRVAVRVTRQVESVGRLAPPLTVALALIKHDRFEWALQKLTELGVDRVVPMTTERTVLSFRVDRTAQRLARWQRIIVEAAEQSGRATLPEIGPAIPFADVLAECAESRSILLWEEEHAVELPQLFDDRPALLLIGPEGGFTAAEVDQARAIGAVTASLGPLILRAETAAISAAAMMLPHRTNQTFA